MTNDNEYKAGAMACQEVLLSLRPLLVGDSLQTTAQYFEKRDTALAAILAAAGPMPARAAGAMACFAEMIVSGEQDGGWYGIGDIKICEAAMTETEKAQAREALSVLCDTAENTNVVSLR